MDGRTSLGCTLIYCVGHGAKVVPSGPLVNGTKEVTAGSNDLCRARFTSNVRLSEFIPNLGSTKAIQRWF